MALMRKAVLLEFEGVMRSMIVASQQFLFLFVVGFRMLHEVLQPIQTKDILLLEHHHCSSRSEDVALSAPDAC